MVALPDATTDGSVLLGKNSDRPAGECQPLRYWPRRPRDGDDHVRLAHVGVPDTEGAWAHLGSSPFWCRGHELGLNEWGVVIGNEALFTRDLAANIRRSGEGEHVPPGILGMELVRLGLERATTARRAIDVMTGLLEAYGQWGSAVPGRAADHGAYDNAYLVADAEQAWILETSGHRWVARAITGGTCALSNQPTIRTEWDRASPDLVGHATAAGWWPGDRDAPFDFARAYADPRTPLQSSNLRLQRSRHLLAERTEAGAIDRDDAATILRDHYEDSFLGGPYFTAGLPDLPTLCMHDSPAGFTWGDTASSAIVRLPREPDRLAHLWWAPTTPCTSVYLPVFPAAAHVPAHVAAPEAPDVARAPEELPASAGDTRSYWSCFHRLLERIKGGEQAWSFAERRSRARRAFDPLERQWAEELPDVERRASALLRDGDDRGRAVLAEFTQRCVRQAFDTCVTLLDSFPEPPETPHERSGEVRSAPKSSGSRAKAVKDG